jgi:glycine/D-amino acid oxidase-like deaminating enzyme
MTVDFLIIGQGISGSWLSYELSKAGKSILVIDEKDPNSPSRLAAGLINPITGRRHVKTWLADEIISSIYSHYEEFGASLGITAISKKDIIDFFPSEQMRESFINRAKEENSYVFEGNNNNWNNQFNFSYGHGKVSPSFTVHLISLLDNYRKQLQAQHLLREEKFCLSELIVKDDCVQYQNITASHIIFCDGNETFSNPYFNKLPFAPNKGEALVVKINDLSASHIYKKGLMLIPLPEENYWWLGSSYAWSFNNPHPTTVFRNNAETVLKDWLKVPFTIEQHRAAIRPATLERRPFVGFHPIHKVIGIFGGMGTKGCSLAPYFAKQFASHVSKGTVIDSDASIARFTGILSK